MMGIHSDLKLFEEEVAQIVSFPVETGCALFYGSSSIRLWGKERLAKQMQPVRTLNHGIGGSTAEQCLYRYGTLVRPYAPSLLVWYCGTNDIALGYSPEEVFALSLRVFEWTRNDFPESRLLVLSTMHNRLRDELFPQYRELNRMVSSYCKAREDARYLDLVEPLCHDSKGEIRDEIFLPDNLHLNDLGYEEMGSLVRPIVLDMMEVH